MSAAAFDSPESAFDEPPGRERRCMVRAFTAASPSCRARGRGSPPSPPGGTALPPRPLLPRVPEAVLRLELLGWGDEAVVVGRVVDDARARDDTAAVGRREAVQDVVRERGRRDAQHRGVRQQALLPRRRRRADAHEGEARVGAGAREGRRQRDVAVADGRAVVDAAERLLAVRARRVGLEEAELDGAVRAGELVAPLVLGALPGVGEARVLEGAPRRALARRDEPHVLAEPRQPFEGAQSDLDPPQRRRAGCDVEVDLRRRQRDGHRCQQREQECAHHARAHCDELQFDSS